MKTAVDEGLLKLEQQRIESAHSGKPSPQAQVSFIPQPVSVPRRHDPAFWRARRSEFEALLNRQRSFLEQETRKEWLKGRCRFTKKDGRFGHCRLDGGLDGNFISRFGDVAAQGPYALGWCGYSKQGACRASQDGRAGGVPQFLRPAHVEPTEKEESTRI